MTIEGQVIDLTSGEGLPSATIAVMGSVVGTQADSQGFFRLTSTLLDNYSQQVQISHVSHAPLILYGFQATGEIPLSRTGSVLDAVVITAKIAIKKQSVVYVLLMSVVITTLIYLAMRSFKFMKQIP